MNKVKQFAVLLFFGLLFFSSHSVSAAESKIGILVFDGFLTSDVTAPIEVFGAATKKAGLSSYEVVVISATKKKKFYQKKDLELLLIKRFMMSLNSMF